MLGGSVRERREPRAGRLGREADLLEERQHDARLLRRRVGALGDVLDRDEHRIVIVGRRRVATLPPVTWTSASATARVCSGVG